MKWSRTEDGIYHSEPKGWVLHREKNNTWRLKHKALAKSDFFGTKRDALAYASKTHPEGKPTVYEGGNVLCNRDSLLSGLREVEWVYQLCLSEETMKSCLPHVQKMITKTEQQPPHAHPYCGVIEKHEGEA